MTDKQKDIKSMIKLIISNIDEFDSEFITYRADSMKRLLEDALEYMKKEEQVFNEIEKYLDAQQKYFDSEDYHNLLNIINKAKKEG